MAQMYKVIAKFEDLQDSRYLYEVGKPYPREGVTVSKARLEALASTKNRRRQPLIEKVVVKEEPKIEAKTEAKADIEVRPRKSTSTKASKKEK